MFCTKCGTHVDQEDNFCRNCGVRIERRSAVAADAAKPAAAAGSGAPKLGAPAHLSNRTDARVSAPNLKEGKGNPAVVGAIGVAVFLAAATGLYFVSGSSRAVTAPGPSSQREEPLTAKILHNEPLASSDENKELSVAADTRLGLVNRSEIVEAPRLAESSKAGADALPSPSKSRTQRSGQDSNRNSRAASEPPTGGGAQPGVYETVHSTTVYENPSASADVVADIPAGVRVNVVSGSGDWLEVHSRRGNPPGFIRRADAVFVESSN